MRKNLINSFPEKSLPEIITIEKRFFKYFTDLVVETIKLNSISKANLQQRFKMNNFEQIEAYFKNGQSVLGCTGHYCNWETGMVAAGLKLSGTAYVIYKPLTSKIFEEWFNGLRTRYGNKMVAMKQTPRQLVATKSQTTIFCFASDQTPTREEVQYRLNFLNQSTPVLLGLEKIAKQTDRPVFYFDVKRVKRGYYEVDCLPLCLKPKDTGAHEITELFFKQLSETIHRAPEFWLWSHKRWKLNE